MYICMYLVHIYEKKGIINFMEFFEIRVFFGKIDNFNNL